MPFNQFGAYRVDGLRVVFQERARDVSTIEQLENGKLPGRYRNTGAAAREVPTTTPTVQSGDAEGDILYNSTQMHVCLSINGSLTWRTITLAVV